MNDRCVYVYVSGSTRDTDAEREALHKHVFPRVEDWCKQLGVQLYVTDLRYMNKNRLPLEICIDEIDKASIFLGIFGNCLDAPDTVLQAQLQRQPWLKNLLTGDKLSITEVEIYRSTLNQESDRRPLREAKGYDYYYFRDNAFLDEDELVATEERSKYVRGVYSKLAGQLSFTPDKQAQAQFNSIKRTVLAKKSDRCKIYNDFPCSYNKSGTSITALDTFCAAVAKDLVAAISALFQVVPNTMPHELVKALIAHQSYFRSQLSTNDAHRGQMDGVVNYALSRTGDHGKRGIGDAEVTLPTIGACLVMGEDGVGKSSFISRLVTMFERKSRDFPPCICHMVQASSMTANIKHLLFSLVYQLNETAAKLAGSAFDHTTLLFSDIPTYDDAKRAFLRSLRIACEAAEKRDTHIIMCIDGIDDLVEGKGPFMELDWLPDWRPAVIGEESNHWLARLRIILTLKTTTRALDLSNNKMKAMRQRCSGPGRVLKIFHLLPLSGEDKKLLIETHAGELPSNEKAALASIISMGLPRYIQHAVYLLQEQWTSLSDVRDICEHPNVMYSQLLQSIEDFHSPEITQKVLCALVCSYGGLYRNELAAFCKVTPAMLLPILEKLKPFLKSHYVSQDHRGLVDLKFSLESLSFVKAVESRYFDWAKSRESDTDISNRMPPPPTYLPTMSFSGMHLMLGNFFRQKCFNNKFSRENTEDAINKAIMDAQGGDGDVQDVLEMTKRESTSNVWRRSTRCHVRGLVCVPFHFLNSKCFNYVSDIMTDLHYLSATCTAGLTYETVYFIQKSKRLLLWGRANQRGWAGLKDLLFARKKKKVKIHTVNREDIHRVRQFATFMESHASWLTIQPYQVFQCAANMPDKCAPGQEAIRLWGNAKDRAACWDQNAVLFTTLSEVPGADMKSSINPEDEHSDESYTIKKLIMREKERKEKEENTSDEKVKENSDRPYNGHRKLSQRLEFLNVEANDCEKRLCSGFRRWIRWVNKGSALEPCLISLSGHTRRINDLSFAPRSHKVGEKSLIASVSDDCTVRVWTQTGECIHIFKSHTDVTTCCNFCPTDMKTLVSGSRDGTLKLWDVVSSTLKYTFVDPHESSAISPGGISTFAWSLDGTKICFGRLNGDAVCVTVSHDNMFVEKEWRAHNGPITCCVLSGDTIMTGSLEDKTFRIWNMDNCEELLRKVAEPLKITLMQRSSHHFGESALTMDNSEFSAQVVLRDSASGIRVVSVLLEGLQTPQGADPIVLEEHRGDSVTACSISKKHVVHATSHGDLHVFDRKSGKSVGSGVLCGHMTAVTACTFSENGEILVSGEEDGLIKVWTPTPLSSLDQKCADVIVSSARGQGAKVIGIDAQHLEFAPSLATVLHPTSVCSSILVSRQDGGIELLDAETGQLCTVLRRAAGKLREHAKFSSDCKRVLAVNESSVTILPVPPEANPIVARGAKEASPSLNSVAHAVDMGVQTVGAWALAPDSICMALSGGVMPPHISSYLNDEAKHLLKFGISTLPGSIGWMQDNHGCLLGIFSGHWSMITQMQFSHDGRHLFSAGRAMEILIWDTHDVKRIDSRGFSAKGKKKPAAKLKLLAVLMPVMHVGTSMRDFSLSPDGFFLVSRHDSKVAVRWDLQETFNHTPTEKQLQVEMRKRNRESLSDKELKGMKTGRIEGITESVVAAHMMKKSMKHTPGASGIFGHNGIITDIAWSPTTSVFATSSVDGTIRVTRAHDSHQVSVLGSQTSVCKILALCFSVDGSVIVSISEDREVRVWRSPLYNNITTLAKINGVVGIDVDWSVVHDNQPFQILPPDMIFKLKEVPTCLRSSYSMSENPRISVGDEGGKVNIFELVDVINRPPPIVTARFTSRLKQQRVCKDKFLSVICPGCHLDFTLTTVPAHACEAIQKTARGQFNTRNIGNKYYTDHRLVTYCPRCKVVLRLNPFESHLPTEMIKSNHFKTSKVSIKKPEKRETADGGEHSDSDSSDGSPALTSFLKKPACKEFKFSIVAFKPQIFATRGHVVCEAEKKGAKVRSSHTGKPLNPLKKIREYSKLFKSRSSIMLDRQHTLTNSSFGISAVGRSEFSEHEQPEGPSLRLTQSHLSKSVVEPSIIEPVERHLPNVRGANKFSHFSRDRVITSFGGGVDFRTYKPL